MPSLPGRPCAHRGCTALVRGRRVRYCPEHQREEWKRQDANRPPSTARGYDPRWQAIRKRFLTDYPLCARCGRAASVAHHIVRIADGGTNDHENLRALCHACHGRIHAEQGDSFGGRDG